MTAPEESFTTVELKVNFFRPIWQAQLRAEGTVVQRGRTIGYVECDITDEEKPIGRESGVYLYGASRPEVCRKVDPVDVTPQPVRDQASTAPSIVGPNLGTPSPQTILFLMRPSGLVRHLINV